MTKMTVAALGVLALVSGTAFAAPAPNDIGTTGMGGAAYFNPSLGKTQLQPENGLAIQEVGATQGGAGVYLAPANGRHG